MQLIRKIVFKGELIYSLGSIFFPIELHDVKLLLDECGLSIPLQ